MAYQLGYEPSYISALERSKKGAPRDDFVKRLIRSLNLTDEEQGTLNKVLLGSRRQILLPLGADEREYRLLHSLETQLGKLSVIQMDLIELALHIPSNAVHCTGEKETQPKSGLVSNSAR